MKSTLSRNSQKFVDQFPFAQSAGDVEYADCTSAEG